MQVCLMSALIMVEVSDEVLLDAGVGMAFQVLYEVRIKNLLFAVDL